MIRLVKVSGLQSPDAPAADVMKAAGYAVILASAAAALLPTGNFESGAKIVGSLMIIVGLFEMLANALRKRTNWAAITAGGISILAGVLIFAQPVTTFVSTVYVVIAWLAVRGLLLFLSAAETRGRARIFALVAAVVDLALGGIVWFGLNVSALVLALFGTTDRMIADFAWVLTLSFVNAGLLLVGVASAQEAV